MVTLSLACMRKMRDLGISQSSGMGKALELRGQLGIGLRQRFEAVEERVDEYGGGEDHAGHDGQGSQPGVEPPAPGSTANEGVQSPQRERGKDQG